jgi:DNA-directed RNA polymerase subunit RPC12/RpoP
MSEHLKPPHTRVSLKVVEFPKVGAVVTAPPIIIASTHTVDYCCGHCSTVLMHAEPGQINNLLIRCTRCGSYNSTDV